jgi:holo-ACP synthase CitX
MDLVDKILLNREFRVKKQRELIKEFNLPLVSLTINIPGIKKDTDSAKVIYDEALKEIKKLPFKIKKILTCKDVGYEAIFVFEAIAKELKKATCKIEESHFLGRFMDIDVIDTNMVIQSRSKQRECFLCSDLAKSCARSQKHDIKELLRYIDEQVKNFKSLL